MMILISYGFYEKNNGDYTHGDRLIGIGVLGTAFVVMPLFIAYRYSQKGVKNYIFPNPENNPEPLDD